MIATIDAPHTLATGPLSLIQLNRDGVALTVLPNCGPFGIWIERGTKIGFADKMNEQDRFSAISEVKSARWTTEANKTMWRNLST